MASKKKSVVATAAAFATLRSIVDATVRGGFVYTLPAIHQPLIAEGLVEINTQVATDANGGIATRATQKGIELVAQKQTVTSADVGTVSAADLTAKAKPVFELQTGIAIPPVAGRGRTGESIYPFEKMEVGQSFFVAKESKNLASTISSANARFAEEIPGETRKNRKGEDVPARRFTRKFVVRTVEENGVKGSRIWRTA